MIFFYYPLILISILGYGFFASKKLLKLSNFNLGYQGIIGIFFLLIISYISAQFIPHSKLFNLIILIIGISLFIIFFKSLNIDKKNINLLTILVILSFIFILVGKNHDDFHYYHFPYTLILTEYTHPIGLGNLNHGFKTHSSIFFLSSLFSLPFANFNLFHLAPAYIMVFSNYVLIKLIVNKDNRKNFIFVTFMSLAALAFINIFFYRLGEHGTDRSAMILIILLMINLIFYINKKTKIIDTNYLKIFTIIFSIIISLKAMYIIYIILFFPLAIYVYEKSKSINLFFNNSLFYSLLLFGFVILTNFLNTGCLIFPEKKTCFFEMPWSLTADTVEYLRIHYEVWAKAGSGAGYMINESEKVKYLSNFNWVKNWTNNYFFSKMSDFLLSLIFISIIFYTLFSSSKFSKNFDRNFKLVYSLLIFITIVWFIIHPALRYGGYHLFFLILFVPFSLFLEKYSYSVKNLDKKILIVIMVIALTFIGRNISRLNKEYVVYSYNPLKNPNYSIGDFSLRYQKKIKTFIKDNKIKKIYGNRYIILN
jgi:hypothetical protein